MPFSFSFRWIHTLAPGWVVERRTQTFWISASRRCKFDVPFRKIENSLSTSSQPPSYPTIRWPPLRRQLPLLTRTKLNGLFRKPVRIYSVAKEFPASKIETKRRIRTTIRRKLTAIASRWAISRNFKILWARPCLT